MGSNNNTTYDELHKEIVDDLIFIDRYLKQTITKRRVLDQTDLKEILLHFEEKAKEKRFPLTSGHA